MAFFLLFLVAAFAASFAAPTTAQAQNSPLLIKLGEARAKKSLIAFPPLQFLGTPGAGSNYQAVGTELFNVIMNDLSVSSYFQFLPQSAFLEDTAKTGLRPAPADPKGFSFQSWSQIGADFLIRGAFSVAGKDVELEIYLYHVPKANLVFGKKYKGTTNTIRQIAHTFSNDVLEQLTGEKGPFLSRLVVASDRGGGQWREIYTMDWDAANPERISSHKSIAMSPAWSWDGKKIAYTAAVQRRRGAPRNHDMFLYDVASGKRSLLSFRQGMNSGASFDPDGKSMYLTVSQGNSPDIYKMSLNGDLELRMTKGPNGAMNVEPNVSRDGSKIAFSSDRSGRTMIFSMNASGGDVKRLTQAGQFNASPSWSPDGKKIAFAGFESNHFDIFVMNADGTGMIRLTKATKPNGREANNEDPSFSPDGRFVMYTSDRTGKNQIYISTVDGSEERRVTNDNFNYYKARWSPNLD
ncbi:MAG: PD40 domain-containing protein [Bdellovibrionaceae bacterium]|nr:PD40 domain-containing protein [Pseudobdellovibrionaceae bacterium]MBX3034098.1 PD40 domain-containing protein [Pseudobdellovibrionaceae bacterium]